MLGFGWRSKMEASYVLKFEADPFRLQKTQDSMSKIPAGLIKVLIADEHEIIRLGLVAMLEVPGIAVVGTASTGSAVLTMAKKLKPSVVLLDVLISDTDAFELAEKISQKLPATKVIMLSLSDNPTYMARAAVVGVSGYLLQDICRSDLIDAICKVAAGTTPKPAAMLPAGSKAKSTYRTIQATLQDRTANSKHNLTPREQQVLRHLALGLSNNETAQSLEITVETVKEYVQNLFKKIHVNHRTQAAVWALSHGFL